jgi:hypothetical protein
MEFTFIRQNCLVRIIILSTISPQIFKCILHSQRKLYFVAMSLSQCKCEATPLAVFYGPVKVGVISNAPQYLGYAFCVRDNDVLHSDEQNYYLRELFKS